MKNFKSVPIIRKTIDTVHEAIQNTRYEDIESMSTLNPTIQSDVITLTKIYEDIIRHGNILVDQEETLSVDGVEEEEEEKSSDNNLTSWLDYKPNAIWKRDNGQSSKRFKMGLMVSNEGDIWDIMHNELLEGRFLNYEMKVKIKGECYALPEKEDVEVRMAPIVCRAFGINSNTKNSTSATKLIIDYIDGDRRNLRPENLRWIQTKSTYPDKAKQAKILAEDVCRRLVEANGDIDETMKRYDPKSSITRGYVSNIRNKLIETQLSSKFFTLDGNKFVPVSNTKETKKSEKSENKTGSKVDEEKVVSDAEKNLLLIKALETFKTEQHKSSKDISAEELVDYIRDVYHVSLPTDMASTVLGLGGIR